MNKNEIINQDYIKAYSEEMLIACQNGKPCNYGICDECPNILNDREDDN